MFTNLRLIYLAYYYVQLILHSVCTVCADHIYDLMDSYSFPAHAGCFVALVYSVLYVFGPELKFCHNFSTELSSDH